MKGDLIPGYCTQNEGNCPICSLVNYGLDCTNKKLWTLGDLAKEITGGNLPAMAKLLNDHGGAELDILEPDSGAFVPRPAIIGLVAERAGDRVGRKAADFLRR